MIIFFDDEHGFIDNYVRSAEDAGWETKYAPTIEMARASLMEIHERDAETDDDPHVYVVDIMFRNASGIADSIPGNMEVGIYFIEKYLLELLRKGSIYVIILTNKNPKLVIDGLRDVGIDDGFIPIWTKNDVSAAIFPSKLEKFLGE